MSKAYRNVNSHVRHRVLPVVEREVRKVQGQGRRRFTSTNICTKSWDCTSFNERSANCSWANV